MEGCSLTHWKILFLSFILASCQVQENINKGAACSSDPSGSGCAQLTTLSYPTDLTLDRSGTNNLNNLPTLTWSQVPQTTIAGYEVALGSFPGASDVLNWTSVGKVTTYQFKNLNLTECRYYYPSLKVVDQAGNKFPVLMETGFYFDQTAPTMTTALTTNNFDGYYDRTVTATWDDTQIRDNCKLFSYQFSVGTYAGASDVLNWTTLKAIQKKQIHDEELSSNLNLQLGISYYTSFRVIDAGGNVSNAASSGAWHFYDPLEISGITYWGDFADHRTMFKDPICSTRVSVNGDNIACVLDRSGGAATLTNTSTFPLPRVTTNLTNENNHLSMAGTYLESTPLSMNSMLVIHKHPTTNVGWNYFMDWRNSVASSWWAAAMVGAHWNRLYINGEITPITTTALFNNDLNISYITGSSLKNNAVLHLGSRFTENEFSHGDFAEIFIFNTVLSNYERQKLEGYLACKWQNQANLSDDHPYKNFCPY